MPWLPDLHSLNWQNRYRNGLTTLLEAERHIRESEGAYGELQQAFEAGILPPDLQQIGVELDSSTVGTLDDGEGIVSYPLWNRLNEGRLGMRGLHQWVDVDPLVGEGDADLGNAPPSYLFTHVDYSPSIAMNRSRTDLLLKQAERHFSLLLQDQPQDVLALDYRARVRQSRAEWMRLSMLPLAQQPLYYPQAGNYRRVMDECLRDLEQAIWLWAEVNDESVAPLSRFARSMAQQSLYDCHLRRYSIYWSEQNWQEAAADLSIAIAMKPAVGLYLARAELSHRLGLFGAEARDCLASLTLVAAHVPMAQRSRFEAGLNQLRLELELGNAALVIRRTLSFWAINPMLIQVV